MVNFRYHLVSLIAVFLALAIGVVLGAGPLQAALNRKDEGAVSAEQLSAELEAASSALSQSDQFIWDVGEEVLPGTLDHSTVALVLLPGAGADAQLPVQRGLETAGATVAATVALDGIWSETDQAPYRETLAQAASAHLATRPSDASADAILAQALVEVLTTSGPAQELLAAMLSDSQTTLVPADDIPARPVDAVVLVGPGPQPAGDPATSSGSSAAQSGEGTDGEQSASALGVALAQAAATVPGGALAVGQADDPGQFIARVRDTGVHLTTVDQGGTAMSGVNAALALADVIAGGGTGAYGQQRGATTAVAPLP